MENHSGRQLTDSGGSFSHTSAKISSAATRNDVGAAKSLLKFYRGVVRIWRKWLNRRARGNRLTWKRYAELLRRHPLLPPRIRHVWT
jgi:hypothetical protein